MRTISIIAFTSFVVLWGAYFFLKNNTKTPTETVENSQLLDEKLSKGGSLLEKGRKSDLDKIGAVINEKTVRLDDEAKAEIQLAKKGFESKQGVKELQALLEDSYLDKNSNLKDIKRLQAEITDKKLKLKLDPTNTEKWDPRFVYYLMIQENYTYAEINMIKSLAENGLNMEEVEYINELIRENAFMEKIMAFKSQGDVGRTVASFKKKKKEADDFIDDVNENRPSIEDRLIEMNYNESQKEEMIYGNNQ
ncbi:MAG: hypothetical protein K2Q18_07975 [Bdellovibrionales bacterium]|nr:hypothetical protein [Bdellovibrionales bacterium]